MIRWKEEVADNNGRQQPVPWKVSDAALATVSVFVGFLVTILLFGLVAGIADVEERTLLTPWFGGVLEGLMLAAAWAFGIRKYHTRWSTLGLRRPQARRSFVLPWVALLGSLGFAGTYAVIVSAIGLESLEPPDIPEDLLGEGTTRLLNSLVLVLWGPFSEEVFFRGFVLAALVPSLGAVRAAVVSSIVFAGAHLMLSALIPIFVTGLLLSWLYIRSRSIWPPMVAHVAQNLIAVSLV